MNTLKPSIAYIFKTYNKNQDMLNYLKAHPDLFSDLIEASLVITHPRAWRSAMLLGHAIKKNDNRIIPFIDDFIACLPNLTHDGHQRQLLIVLDRFQLNEDQNGHLFNHCLSIWEEVQKISSTRIRAFQAMVKMTNEYPELKDELRLFTTDYYTKTLTEGIKISFLRLVANNL